MTGAQAPLTRVPLADGTLVATAELPPDDLIPSLLVISDVLGTGWYAATARVRPARRSSWWVTARLGSWACLRRNRWAPSGSSR